MPKRWIPLATKDGYCRYVKKSGQTYFATLIPNEDTALVSVNKIGSPIDFLIGAVPLEDAQSEADVMLEKASYK